ncbi:hypothetical protein AVEN_105133-1 [Araneus ventricosus]|uniref:Tc1-like transposase DDE domain-containing protein n=1 Tax=Araneus ventricosus TaxID=182803 RepID=A0A4Y2U3K6_ARAVE|nr:hypothetical protein AVEN_105133-1 [Araneus ventricosus]
MLSDGVILLHDNTHAARKTQELLQKFKWEVCSPPPHAAQIWHTIWALIWNKVLSDSDVKTANENVFSGLGRDFYQAGLNKFVLLSDKRLYRFGVSVEK